MSIRCKPSVSGPDQQVETGKAEEKTEGPRPPDPACYIQIDIGTGAGRAISGQQSYIAQDLITGHAERIGGPIGLKSIHFETPATQNGGPKVQPANAESAITVIEDPARS